MSLKEKCGQCVSSDSKNFVIGKSMIASLAMIISDYF